MLQKMRAVGLSLDDAIELALMWEEGVERQVSSSALRMRRKRERDANPSQCDVTCDAQSLSPSPSSPTPPSSTNPIQLPPIVPQKAKPKAAEKPPSVDALVEKLWMAGNQASRTRSGRADLRKAVSLAVKAGATAEALEASVKAHCREAGDHAKGLHRLINGEHWRDYGPKPPATAAPILPEIEEQRIRHLRDTGEWREAWGERPKAA